MTKSGETKKKTKRGRPRINIEEENFYKLCGLQCTLKEIAAFFSCSEDTIENWCKRTFKMNFSDIYAIKASMGKISLRRSMFRMAETNPKMAIWLSKQHLGMKDKIETENINYNNNIDVSKLSDDEIDKILESEE